MATYQKNYLIVNSGVTSFIFKTKYHSSPLIKIIYSISLLFATSHIKDSIKYWTWTENTELEI